MLRRSAIIANASSFYNNSGPTSNVESETKVSDERAEDTNGKGSGDSDVPATHVSLSPFSNLYK